MNQYLLKRLGWYAEKNTRANSNGIVILPLKIRAQGDCYAAGAILTSSENYLKHSLKVYFTHFFPSTSSN